MYEEWKVLHLDEVEAESILFCRALSHEKFSGHCESVRNMGDAKLYLERGLYTPQLLSRPDIIVVNWHPDCDAHVLEFVHWVRGQAQLHATPIIVFLKAHLSIAARESAQQEGVTEMLVRPETFEGLFPQVRALLERCAYRCTAGQAVLARLDEGSVVLESKRVSEAKPHLELKPEDNESAGPCRKCNE